MKLDYYHKQLDKLEEYTNLSAEKQDTFSHNDYLCLQVFSVF